jgi:hypothetical protein
VGLRQLSTVSDNLRDSPCFRWKSVVEYVSRGGLAYSNWDVLSSQKYFTKYKKFILYFILWII